MAKPISIPDYSIIDQMMLEPIIYNLPTCDEIATISEDNAVEKVLDITIVNNSCGQIEQIYETYVSFKSLQYPSLFIFGEYEYQVNIKIRSKDHKNVELTGERFTTRKSRICYETNYSYHATNF